MQNFDVIATAKEAAAKCEPITSLLEVISIDENSGIFGLGSEGKNENKMVVDRLHRHGYLTIQLPEKLTSLILELGMFFISLIWC